MYDNSELIINENCKQSRSFHSVFEVRLFFYLTFKMDKDKIDAFMGAVERNQYDIDSWHSLLRQIHNEKIDLYRESVYEKLIRVFPTSGKFWKVYIEHEVCI